MLEVKKSYLPGAGKGLFTTKPIKKGDAILEYEGEIITWAECERRNAAKPGDQIGGYFFHVNKRKCIDAEPTLWAKARYANDAGGVVRLEGVRNNCCYEIRKGTPYIVASRNLKAGEEIFVSYGRGYWRTMGPYLMKKLKLKEIKYYPQPKALVKARMS